MVVNLDFILFNQDELCSRVVEHAKYFVSENELASRDALNKISSPSDWWNYRVAFAIMKEREPRLVRNTLLDITQKYNSNRKELAKTHPIFLSRAWDLYKMTGVSFRSPVFDSMFKTESDESFARFYVRQQWNMFMQQGRSPFEAWSDFEKLEYDSEFLFGVGKYKFRDKRGNEMETIWDLRQEKFPAFIYAREL
jgi:hypothetical protein